MNKPSMKRINAGFIDFDFYYFCPGYLYRDDTIKKFPGTLLVSNSGKTTHLIFDGDNIISSQLEDMDKLILPTPTEVLMVYYSTYMLLHVKRTNNIMVFSLIKNINEDSKLTHVFDIKLPNYIDNMRINGNTLEFIKDDNIIRFNITIGPKFMLTPFVEPEQNEIDIYAKLPKKVITPLPTALSVPPEQAYIYNYELQQFEGPAIFKHEGVGSFTQVENFILACMSAETAIFDLFNLKYLEDKPWQLSYQPHPTVLHLEDQFKYLPSIKGILPTKKMRKWNTLNPDYTFRDPDDIEHFREMLESKF